MTRARRITVAEVEQAIGIPAPEWISRCHEIAILMVEKGLVKGRTPYGHWTGPVAPATRFWHTHLKTGFVRHGWIETADGMVMDPTRWAFEAKEPYIYRGPKDHYDEGGRKFRAQVQGPHPVYDPEDKKYDVPPDVLDTGPWNRVEALLDIDVSVQTPGELTVPQLFWLANLDPARMGEHAAAIYTALAKLGLRGFVPIDNWTAVFPPKEERE